MIEGDRVFLIRQTYSPGCSCRRGGSHRAAEIAAPQMLEETGYRPTAPMPCSASITINVATNRDHVALYVCREFEMVRPFKRNGESPKAGWFTIAGLPDEPRRRGASTSLRRRAGARP
jgi:hypothetical protein